MAKRVDLTEVQGDTFGRTINVSDDSGSVDISGWTFYVTVKDSYDDDDTNAALSDDITSHDAPSNGVSSFAFPPADTEDLSGSYYYDIKYDDGSGDIETFLRGTINFVESARNTV